MLRDFSNKTRSAAFLAQQQFARALSIPSVGRARIFLKKIISAHTDGARRRSRPDPKTYLKTCLVEAVPMDTLGSVGVDRRHAPRKKKGDPRSGRLNAVIAGGGIGELVQQCEAMHMRQCQDIIGELAARGSDVRLILIAGPSSSGKDTCP